MASPPSCAFNRMMRGAAVEAGSHRLVYTYRPRSFRLGMMVSLAALAVVALWATSRYAIVRNYLTS